LRGDFPSALSSIRIANARKDLPPFYGWADKASVEHSPAPRSSEEGFRRKTSNQGAASVQGVRRLNWSQAIEFVRRRGNRLNLLRLYNLMDAPSSRQQVWEVLAAYQFPDGSWDNQTADEQSNRVGSLGGTIHCLRWVREFRLASDPHVDLTVGFLTTIQNADGSFYEIDRKLAQAPQPWLQTNTLVDRFFFTAAVPMRLMSIGRRHEPLITAALEWLRRHWDERSLVIGTWYNLWTLLCLMKDL